MESIRIAMLIRAGKACKPEALQSYRTRLARAIIRAKSATLDLRRVRGHARELLILDVMRQVKCSLLDDTHPVNARRIVKEALEHLTDEQRKIKVRDVYFDPESSRGLAWRRHSQTRSKRVALAPTSWRRLQTHPCAHSAGVLNRLGALMRDEYLTANAELRQRAA